ncbi:MAG TPA: DNA-3-methyladenine glycosylase I [Anaerolineaceae bacterium]|nr:DNA-3-methyladenine glycosylase I [Anaerolineaceae bacterium]HPN51288.1 DNA-3-methyladenine glycosylase I [Anaerolineaceae bacterium]
MSISRCPWGTHDVMQAYHDTEWGTPVHDERKLFEFLVLDMFQAGLSWAIILKKREAFRRAFDDFELEKIVAYDDERVAALMADAGIVRNRRKIQGVIQNAGLVRQLHAEGGTLDALMWSFTGGKTLHNAWQEEREIPAVTPAAEAMSRELRRRGFTFVGPTICYAVMQSIGMVNDHIVSCFRYRELGGPA